MSGFPLHPALTTGAWSNVQPRVLLLVNRHAWQLGERAHIATIIARVQACTRRSPSEVQRVRLDDVARLIYLILPNPHVGIARTISAQVSTRSPDCATDRRGQKSVDRVAL